MPVTRLPPSPASDGLNEPALLATVSVELVEDLLSSIRRISTPETYSHYLRQSGIDQTSQHNPQARITHDQLVRLYQVSAIGTGDEMMGLWSRPIRRGALKYICKVLLDARHIDRAMYRLCQFWNLLLDDFALALVSHGGSLAIELHPRTCHPAAVNRFGHLLMLKLIHGITSWLVGRELPVRHVGFSFPRPEFAGDYPLLFPSPVEFDRRHSAISFDAQIGQLPVDRHPGDVQAFLERAPRDWIFTAYKEHAVQLKVREFLYAHDHLDRTLADVAKHLNVSARTLLRRLAEEGQSFQAIKDGLRRDIAIREMIHTRKSLDEIAYDIGFSSVAVFHRAFKKWTGVTPGRYRRQAG